MDMSQFSNANGYIKGIDFDRSYLECETMLAQANTLIQEKRSQESVELLLKILQRNSQFGKAYNHLGYVYEIDYRDYTRAEEYYKKAMKYEPEYSAAYTHYARLLSSCKRFDELKAHLDIALTISTVSAETIYFEYGLMYEMQQNPEAAIDYYIKAAMTTLDTHKVTFYQGAINRCKTKLELKNSLSER
ncbi:tetratricopeptide repeat protein [Aliterella atlantica]|uniref:tetratricopeptide repeat protein n=1 Tax=Aliterella atlantica TaxID=1827278 RepID=UPI00069640C0|nr:tetratricopeptide repeat protein [Aliterella atlantica]